MDKDVGDVTDEDGKQYFSFEDEWELLFEQNWRLIGVIRSQHAEIDCLWEMAMIERRTVQ